MKDAVSLMRWAILFIVVDINLGRFDVLPAFAAYMMYISCLELMKEEYPELLRLKSFCRILVIVSFVYWAAEVNFPLLDLLITLLELYVTYTILSFMADYGIRNELPGAASLQKCKNLLIIFRVILFAFLSYLDAALILMIVFWSLYMLLVICIWVCLSDMKNQKFV